MTPFRLKIVAPDKEFFDGEVQMLVVRTTEGNKGILAHHISYVANLNTGFAKVVLGDNSERIAAISGGSIKVGNNEAIILATGIEWADEIDIKRAERAKVNAEELLKSKTSGREFEKASFELKRAVNRLSVAKK